MEINEFNNLILPFKKKLFKLAVVMLKSQQDAEDALQEVFLRLWKNRDRLYGVINMEAYVMRTTKNFCLDKLKASKRTVDIADHDYQLENEDNSPYKKLELSDSMVHMQKVFETLPDLQRTIIYMRDVEGYSFEEMEEITGLNANALRVNLSRARKNARVLFLKLNAYENN